MGGWGTVGCGGYLGLEILARKQIANRLGHSLPRHLSKRTPPPILVRFQNRVAAQSSKGGQGGVKYTTKLTQSIPHQESEVKIRK